MKHDPTSFDVAVQAWVLAHQSPPIRRAFVIVTDAGGITAMYVIALCAAAFLWYRGQRHNAAGALAALAVSVALFAGVKPLFARARPIALDGALQTDYSFPSGHATTSTAVCVTLAYVFWREGFMTFGVAIAIGLFVPLLVGVSRVYLNVHWATDVIGGWVAGIGIAAVFVALYNRRQLRQAT